MASSDCEKFLAALSQKIYALRLERKDTQTELAKRSNLQQSAIARIENGVSPNIGIKTLYELAKASSLPLSELIKRAESENAPDIKEELWKKMEREVGLLPMSKRTLLAQVLQLVLRCMS